MARVFSEPFQRHYYASRFSSAYCFKLAAYIFIIVLTIVITASTESLWLKVAVHYEQPKVTFTHNAFLLLEGPSIGNERVWSTFQEVNDMFVGKLLSVDVQVSSLDLDHDGRVELVDLSLSAAGLAAPVHSAKLLLSFQYDLEERVKMRMQSLAYIHHSSGIPGSSLAVDGELRFRQGAPLDFDHVRTTYDSPAFFPYGQSRELRDVSQLQFSSILREYLARNETTEFVSSYPVWTAGNGPIFSVSVRVRVPTHERVEYVPGLLEVIKFAWMQLLSIYVVLWYLFQQVLYTTYHYRILRTRVVSDLQQGKLHQL